MGRCIIFPPSLSEKSKKPPLSLWNTMAHDRNIMMLLGVNKKESIPFSCREGSVSSTSPPATLCNIDLLRGLGAFAILFWHYQHFYFPRAGVNGVSGQRAVQPLFDMFSWFYLHGAWAVQFFWILSGFIFFHVYAQRGDVSLREFFGNRFSRLYPLHFITLCIVAVLQFVSWQWFGQFQIYPFNDLWHFSLNVFMASHWGFQDGYSFNAPIWSISVELLVYGMFYGFLRAVGVRFLTSVLWLGWSLVFYMNSPGPVFECAALFALGGVVNQLHAWLTGRSMVRLSMIGAVSLFVLAMVSVKFGEITLPVGVKWAIFPALIWLAAALDAKGWSSGAVGLALGNITYSSYLLHVPMQIAIIMVMDGIIGSRHAVSTPEFLMVYLLGVIGMAALAYRFVEHPLKLYCKRLLLGFNVG